MTRIRRRRHVKGAFTLVELLTAIAILSVMMVFIGLIMTAASKATKLSRQRLDADSQARLVFDSMADDFTRMLRRTDVDFHFVKGSYAATPGVNDTFFMFCENPGYFSASLTPASESNVSLMGYRIYSQTLTPAEIPYTLEKMAKGLAWDLQASTNPVIFLTLDQPGTTFAPNLNSTIVGQWPTIDQPSYTDPAGHFHLLGDSTFRLEFCFLLTDGTYSLVPALYYPHAGTPIPPSGTAVISNLNASAAPTPSDGSNKNYGVGSRWYDTTNCRSYICTSAPPGSTTGAVWQPLGMADVQAVVVAIAILDQGSQKMISTNTTALSTMAQALANPTTADLTSTPPQLMATTWLKTVNTPTFAASVGVPQVVGSQVRIYQRFFYLNNLTNN